MNDIYRTIKERPGELFLIAGPCVIESESHAMMMAGEISAVASRLDVPLIFKASYDKANRSSARSYRGIGMDEGLEILRRIKEEFGLPVITDVHESDQVAAAAEIADCIQIPAFLCRQTDLLESAARSGRVVNVKKGQFLAPWEVGNIIEKIEGSGNRRIMLTERGTSFGYNNLIVDMRSFPIMREFGYPVVFDVTHSLQLPGGLGDATDGQSDFIEHLARAGVACGIDGLFMEVHDNPPMALSDATTQFALNKLEPLLETLLKIHRLVQPKIKVMNRFFLCLAVFISLASSLATTAFAQEFEIKKYDLDARVVPEEYKVEVKARLRLVNLSSPDLADKILLATNDKPRLSFYLNQKTKVESMKVNNADVAFKSFEDVRNNLIRVGTDITSTIATSREFDVELAYSIPSADRSASLHISHGGCFLLPASFWVPVIHTPYADHGADTAPFSINVTAPAGLKIVSSGIRKSEGSFEQSMAGQPFFIVGDYESINRGGDAYPVEVYLPHGAGEMGKQQAQRLAAEAERIVAFYVKYFGVSSTAPFRMIATDARQLSTATTDAFSQSRESSFTTVGAVTIDDSFFRRDLLDLGTIELVAGAAARAWVDGQVLLRGRGTGMLRDALPVYLAAYYLGERYGVAQREEAFERYRRAYGTIARNDAPLLMQSQLDRNYTTSVFNKGALIWRMIEKQVGKQTFDSVLRASLTRTRVDVLSLNEWRSPLCGLSRCTNIKNNLLNNGADRKIINEIFTNWIDTVVLPDIAIGQPQKTPNGTESTVANFGSGDITIDVIATTDKGEKLKQSVAVKASEYGSVSYPAGVNIATIEADPDKLYLQSDYSNDIYPRIASESEAFGQANLAFSKNDFATAESKARAAIKSGSSSPTLESLLGRALLAQNKRDEAAKVFESILKIEPLTIQAYGWAHLGLGDIATQQNTPAEAARHYRLAAAADIDAATTIAARDGALKAERAANSIKIPEDIKAFLQKFDAAILQSTAAAVNPYIELGNLRKFAQSLVVRKPSAWTTEALRVEEWDAARTAVDVTLKIRIESKDYSGRAVYVISKEGGSNKMLLTEVPVFDVK